MCSISVLMSIFNETIDDINKAINSILNQTYSDFEFIIIVDNPKRSDLKEKLCLLDSRIKVLVNEYNIGLAQSMNRAASIAKGKYLARMDADDISLCSRFDKQYRMLIENDYSLVCTGYVMIDEFDNPIGVESEDISDSDLVRLLPFDNTIHHPTVMMKKTLFDKVGGYRNFPCSQDYDLWLRMILVDNNFHYIPDRLFQYRIREGSISQKNKVKQITTWWYIQSLYKQRKKGGTDSYSETNYLKYLKKNNVFDEKYCKDEINARKIKSQVDMLKKEKNFKVKRFALICKILCISSFYRKYYFRVFKYKIIKRFAK